MRETVMWTGAMWEMLLYAGQLQKFIMWGILEIMHETLAENPNSSICDTSNC